jgi:hypothetical protein
MYSILNVDENPCEPLSRDEASALKNSLSKMGFLPACPIVLSAGPACEGMIIDGFHRKKYCDELGIEPVYVLQECHSELEFKALQIRLNLHRRQLTSTQRSVLVARLAEIDAESKRQNQEKTQFGTEAEPADASDPPAVNGESPVETTLAEAITHPATTENVSTVEDRARLADVSPKTQSQTEQVMASDEEDLKDAMQAGRIGAEKALRELRRRQAVKAGEDQEPEVIPTVEATPPPSQAFADEATTFRPIDRAVGIALDLEDLIDQLAADDLDDPAREIFSRLGRKLMLKGEPLYLAHEPPEEPEWEYENIGGPA